MTDKLLPCPFCGADADPDISDTGVFWVRCKTCAAEGSCEDTEAAAIEVWNTRNGVAPEAFQARVRPWMLACFGPIIPFDKTERNHRFLEEALELVQSIGCTQSEAHQLVDYVFGREIGETPQEVGGVMVTLAALCIANDLDMDICGETELARIWTKVEKIRAKQAAKPKHSPLPEATPSTATSDGALWDLFKDHYWDSFDADKEIVLKHIRSVLDVYKAATLAPSEARGALAELSIDDEGNRDTCLKSVLISGFTALKWALPIQAAEEMIDAILATPTPSDAMTDEPVAYRIGHSGGGHHYFDAADARFKDQMQPLYATPPSAAPDQGVREALADLGALLKYARWTISPESPTYHPTMPSAVDRAEVALAFVAAALSRPAPDAAGSEWKDISMSDIRLVAGEGKLSAHDTLAAVNGHMRSKLGLAATRNERGGVAS